VASALSAFFSGWGVSNSAFSANLKEKPLLLRYASFHGISDRHNPLISWVSISFPSFEGIYLFWFYALIIIVVIPQDIY